MSHEIRTPLNAIIGFSDILSNSNMETENQEKAEIISKSAKALLNIINDILDFSKIEARKLDLEVTAFDLRQALEDVLELISVKAHEKNLELTLRIMDDVPCCLEGDPGRLRQILFNLSGNAVKFTEEGEVGVTVTLEKETHTDVLVRFDVSDTGIGIPREKHALVFEAFRQADMKSVCSAAMAA